MGQTGRTPEATVPAAATGADVVEVIYDGQCPACSAYVRLQRLEENGVHVRLIDAREHPEVVSTYSARGIDLNRDFVVRVGAAEYIGGDGAFVLASLGAKHSLLRRMNGALFRSRAVSRVLYPALRAGRRVLLFLLGRKLIEGAGR